MSASSEPTGSQAKPVSSRNALKRLAGKFAYSWAGRLLARLPFFSEITRRISRSVVEHQVGKPTIFETREISASLETTLQTIIYDVVETLGYVGAMVATHEAGNTLPVRALYINPRIITIESLEAWTQELARQFGLKGFSPSNPEFGRVYVLREEYRNNLSARAARKGQPVISDNLFDLLTPMLPDTARSAADSIQQTMGIHQFVAVPFFIESDLDGELKKEFVGNLLAGKTSEISQTDIRVLTAFAGQVAAAMLGERRRLQTNITQQLVLDIQRGLVNEEQILNHIVQGMVTDLGYVGAMVATYEAGDALPVRATYVDPEIADMQRIQVWVDELSAYTSRPLSLTDPEIARVYVHKEEYHDNLSVKAAQQRKPVVGQGLYDLFTPIVPEIARGMLTGIQEALGIHQVIAAPFFLETYHDGKLEKEFIGNLFAATRSQEFQNWEIELLGTFGQQAAAGLRNARLYRQSESRRIASEIFGKMAFSATAALHAFRNHIGVIRMSVQMVDILSERQGGINDDLWHTYQPKMIENLDQLTSILESLHEPFKQVRDEPVDVNICLKRALQRIAAPEGWVQITLADNLPMVSTMPEMLTEAFKVIIKNAVEAIRDKGTTIPLSPGENGYPLTIQSSMASNTNIEITVSDQGAGVRPEKMGKLFSLGVSTKSTGLGFGLFWTKDYIEGLGGSIKLESQWGIGTTVTICLPIKD